GLPLVGPHRPWSSTNRVSHGDATVSAPDPRRYMPTSHSARPRLFPLLLVVAAVILVPAIAFASSLDPSWLEGVCNDADGDDLLSLIDDIVATEAACLPRMSPPPHFYKTAFTLRPNMTSSHAANRFTRWPPYHASTP